MVHPNTLSNTRIYRNTKIPMDEKKRFFDSHITIRISKEMKDIIDFWVSNPQCVFEGKPLFDSRGHFVKASIIKHLRELKERYKAL